MEKKLTAQGPKDRKSYTVTLPIEWVKQEGLEKTRMLDLNIVGHKIILSSHKEAKKQIQLDGTTLKDTLMKALQGCYRSGLNEIRLSFKDEKVVAEAISIIEKKLIGYEILEQKKDYMIIKDITKESEEDFKSIFRRIFLLLLELVESRDASHSKNLDKNIKKLTNYCQRILMKKGHKEFTKIPLYYIILDRLEKISDSVSWMFDASKNEHKKMKELENLLRIAYELFYKFDDKKFNDNCYKAYDLKNKVRKELPADQTTILMHGAAQLLLSLYGDIYTLKFND